MLLNVLRSRNDTIRHILKVAIELRQTPAILKPNQRKSVDSKEFIEMLLLKYWVSSKRIKLNNSISVK